jgi:dTMP kinase
MRGRFITFEGGEGSGKSTQTAALAQQLRAHDIDVLLTREPGGSPGAEIIRHVILSGAARPFGTDVEAILFAAARDDHLRVTILPALLAGRWVICDRFLDSTRAYQGALGAVDPQLIRSLERVTVGDNIPDLTIILDVPAEIGMTRAAARRGAGQADRFEAEDLSFHHKLRETFLEIARREPERCVVIDGTQAPEQVKAVIWQTVRERFGLTDTIVAPAVQVAS